MEILDKKYRLLWDINTLIISNDYTRDYTGTVSRIVNPQFKGYFESDVYQDILDKITELNLIEE